MQYEPSNNYKRLNTYFVCYYFKWALAVVKRRVYKMSCFKPGPGANKYPNLTDVPIVNPCEGYGYKAPFREVSQNISNTFSPSLSYAVL